MSANEALCTKPLLKKVMMIHLLVHHRTSTGKHVKLINTCIRSVKDHHQILPSPGFPLPGDTRYLISIPEFGRGVEGHELSSAFALGWHGGCNFNGIKGVFAYTMGGV